MAEMAGAPRLPDRPTLDGLEQRWARRWQEEGTYAFDRSADRASVYAIDTPPPTVSGSLHIGHVFSYTHTDLIARFWRMRGKAVFFPIGWDDNGLPTERRVQYRYGVRCDPGLPYDQAFTPPTQPDPKRPVAISRQNFIELCERQTARDEQAYEQLWRQLGLSYDWSYQYTTIGATARAASQRAFLRNLRRGEAYAAEAPTLWDVTFATAVAQAELEDREIRGAYYRLRFSMLDATSAGEPASRPEWVEIKTTRPELLPACVALVCHPDDDRYAGLVGQFARTPVFGARVPVCSHPLADPEQGTGLAMVCTFGDLTDVTWWRDLHLATRVIIGRDGTLQATAPDGVDPAAYARLAGLSVAQARQRVVQLLSESGDLIGQPGPITHPVKFYEKGELPLEIVSSRQWYIRNGGRDELLRQELLAAGVRLHWVPASMRHRYANWVGGLSGDWLISRQRFFGVPFPVWYRLDRNGEPDYDDPLLPDEQSLPVDPASQAPAGFDESQRGQPHGFIGDPDVMDTWATSSLTPQIASGWERDPDLFGRVFPMDLRPQSHEIIRTWLFATVLRARAEHGVLPWHTVDISGWVLDPDRKKLSKSKSKGDDELAPEALLSRYGADALRYWATRSRPGVDTTLDLGQIKVGRRLATKILNASRFVLGLFSPSAVAGAAPLPAVGSARDLVTEPLDRSLLDRLAGTVLEATRAFVAYDHAGALAAIEGFFWEFCDDYIELVKDRAYGTAAAPPGAAAGASPAATSARTALAVALDVQLRLFAPFLPYVTEEVWSWWREGSVHRAQWPSPEVDILAGAPPAAEVPAGAVPGGDVLAAVAAALAQVRRAKSQRRLSLRAQIARATVTGPAEVVQRIALAQADLRTAARVAELDLAADAAATELTVTCEF